MPYQLLSGVYTTYEREGCASLYRMLVEERCRIIITIIIIFYVSVSVDGYFFLLVEKYNFTPKMPVL